MLSRVCSNTMIFANRGILSSQETIVKTNVEYSFQFVNLAYSYLRSACQILFEARSTMTIPVLLERGIRHSFNSDGRESKPVTARQSLVLCLRPLSTNTGVIPAFRAPTTSS